MTRTKIQEVKNNDSVQYRTTLPKQLIESLGLKKDDLLDWKIFDSKMLVEGIRK